MKLVRYGNPGKEKPGLIDAEGKLRDLSGVLPDIGPAQLGDAALAKLRRLKTATLPLVRGKPRLGSPVGAIGKFIAIGLNYADHAAESGLPIPKEPVVFTGEDGFEVYAAPEFAEQLWRKMLETGHYGSPEGILPCGLAARNTLRLESAMSLYGHELGDDISTLEANLGWITKLNKESGFAGRDKLAAQKEAGLTRKIAGFEMTEPGIARDGYDVYCNGEKCGVVTSGSPAPFLKKNIGLAFLPPDFANVGQEIRIDVRGKHLAAVVVPTPFYKRQK